MSQGAYVTLVGYVAQDPNIRTTATGKQLTKVRVGTTPGTGTTSPGSGATARRRTTTSSAGTGWPRTSGQPAQGRAGHRQGEVQDQHVRGQERPDEDLGRDHGGHPGTRPEPGRGQLHARAVAAPTPKSDRGSRRVRRGTRRIRTPEDADGPGRDPRRGRDRAVRPRPGKRRARGACRRGKRGRGARRTRRASRGVRDALLAAPLTGPGTVPLNRARERRPLVSRIHDGSPGPRSSRNSLPR